MFKKLKLFFERNAEEALADIIAPLQRIHDKLEAHIEKIKASTEAHLDTIDTHLNVIESLEDKIVENDAALRAAESAKAKFAVVL